MYISVNQSGLHTVMKPKKQVTFEGHKTENKHSTFSESEAATVTDFVFQQQAARQILDHQQPRGAARYPVWTEKLGEKLSNLTVGIDFLPHRVSSTVHSITNWASHCLGCTNDPTHQAEQAHARATQVVDAIAQQIDLSTIADIEQGLPETVIKERLVNALQHSPQLLYVANNALSHPVIAVLKWPVVAKPNLRKLVEAITFSELAIAEPELPQAPEQNQLPEANGQQAVPPNNHPAFNAQKAAELATELQASGALSARGTQGLASLLRRKENFQIKDLTPQEVRDDYLIKGKYPPLQNPHEFMSIKPEASRIQVYDKLPPQPQGGIRGFFNKILPYKKETIVDREFPFTVVSPDPNAQLLIAALVKDQDFPPIEPGTPVVVKIRDDEDFKRNVFQPIINTFRITDSVEIYDSFREGTKRNVELKESCLWPFLEGVLLKGEKGLGPRCFVKGTRRKCFDVLANANIYQFESPNQELATFLNRQLHENTDPKVRDLKARLAAIQIASLQYAEQVEVAETIVSFMKGTALGVAGDKLAGLIGGENVKAGENVFKDAGFWTRVGFLSVVDAIDNWYGEHGVLEADLKGMGLTNTREHVFGNAPPPDPVRMKHYLSARHATRLPPSIDEFRRRLLLLVFGDADGRAAQAVASTYRSIGLGVLGGALLSLYPAKTFTEQDSTILERAGATSLGTLGALSIPINFSLTLPRVMSTLNEHLEEGRLLLPETINKNDKKAVQAYILEMALQDMMSRTGLQASAKAYSAIPLLGLGWLSEFAIPRPIVQTIMFSTISVAENITRMGLMLNRVNRIFPQSISNTEGTVLAAHIKGEEDLERYQENIRNEFNGAWSRAVSHGLNYVTYPLQVALTHRRKIDFHDGPDYSVEAANSNIAESSDEVPDTREQRQDTVQEPRQEALANAPF